MRTDYTDKLGSDMTLEFRNSDLSVTEFINSKIASGAFDITETTFHTIERNNIISYYFVADRNRWYAKF